MKRLVLLAIFAASPAVAQDRPSLLPTRDVDVTYHVNSGGLSINQRWRYQAADRIIRLDIPQPGVYMIINETAHVAEMVDDNGRKFLQIPMPDMGPTGLRPGQSFTRLGPDTVAGVPCTEWQTKDSRGQDTAACITADGVMLRARRGATVVVEATRVAYGPVDPAAFTVPPGYQRETPSAAR